jgi:hypothetical protein
LIIGGLSFSLTILAGAATPEKTTPAHWIARLDKQRDSLRHFEAEIETYRFAVRNSTSAITYEEAETFLTHVPEILSLTPAANARHEALVTELAKEACRVFGVEPEVTEVENEIHQRDSGQAFYRIWERRSKSLSFFDRRGCWHQDDNEITLGPPPGDAEIEIYLARLGLLLPKAAVAEGVLEATPSDANAALAYVLDLEGSRFRFQCQPWKGTGMVKVIQEISLWEGKEQGVLEKRVWFEDPRHAAGKGGGSPPSSPLIGIALQYHSNTSIESFAIHQLVALRETAETWSPFPRERPPFGWPVLDYRFKPEVEFRFGYARR